MSTVVVKWMEEKSRLFACRDSNGHLVMAGSWPGDDAGWQEWKAAKPSDMLLMALASCAGHDVVAILERQRQKLAGLRIAVDGQQLPDPPFTFTNIHLHFILTGESLDPVKVQRALDLSINNYCSVAATIRGMASITYGFEIGH